MMHETLTTPYRNVDEARATSAESVGPSLKLVSWQHTPENGVSAAKAVQDCEVVALEFTDFRDAQQRAQYDAAATTFISSKASSVEMARAHRVLEQYYSAPVAPLLEALKGTDKRIVTIDVDRDDPALHAFNRGNRYLQQAEKTVHYAPTSKIKQLLHKAAAGMAAGNAGREAVVVGQLEDLVKEYAGTDVKIGVLVGSNHTPISHQMSRLHNTERVQVMSRYLGQHYQERAYVPPRDQMTRHYRLLPGVPVPESVVDRAVLHITQVMAGVKGVAANNLDRARLLEDMPDSEVSETVLALDGIKAGVRARLRPKRTLAKMDAMIEARLMDAGAKKLRPHR